MFALFVNLQIKPEHRVAYIQAQLENAKGTNNEPGCLRYDLLQDDEDPNRLYVYEVFKDRETWEGPHRQSPHFIRFRDTVRGMNAAEPIRRYRHDGLPTRCSLEEDVEDLLNVVGSLSGGGGGHWAGEVNTPQREVANA